MPMSFVDEIFLHIAVMVTSADIFCKNLVPSVKFLEHHVNRCRLKQLPILPKEYTNDSGSIAILSFIDGCRIVTNK